MFSTTVHNLKTAPMYNEIIKYRTRVAQPVPLQCDPGCMVWWHMTPSAMPVSSRRLPDKTDWYRHLFTTDFLCSNFPNLMIIWRKWCHHGGDCSTFCRSCAPFLGDPCGEYHVCPLSKGIAHLWSISAYRYRAGEGRKWILNAIYKAEFYSLKEKHVTENELSGEGECWLITGPVLLRSDSVAGSI